MALGCGARSGLDPNRLALDDGAAGASGGTNAGGAATAGFGYGGAGGGNIAGGVSMSGAPSGGFSQGGAIMTMAGTGGIVTDGAGGSRPSEAGAAGDDGAGGEPPEPSVVEMSVGAFHSCARFDDGSLRCFGSTLHSGLALGSNFVLLGDDEPASDAADVVIGGRVAQISASWYQTCALRERRSV